MPELPIVSLAIRYVSDISNHTVAVEVWSVDPKDLLTERLSLTWTSRRDEVAQVLFPAILRHPRRRFALEFTTDLVAV